MPYSIIVLIQRIFSVYEGLIFIWCLMSWIPRSSGGLVEDIRGALGMIVEPYVGIFRRFVPPLGGIDFSPIVAIFALSLIQRVVVALIL